MDVHLSSRERDQLYLSQLFFNTTDLDIHYSLFTYCVHHLCVLLHVTWTCTFIQVHEGKPMCAALKLSLVTSPVCRQCPEQRY